MRVSKSCAKCLYDKQAHLSQDEVYLEEVRNIINNRKEKDTAPYLQAVDKVGRQLFLFLIKYPWQKSTPKPKLMTFLPFILAKWYNISGFGGYIMAMTNRDNSKFDSFIIYTLNEHVPQDHFVRKLENALDFRFIYPKVRHLYSRHGRPSIDPVVLFKMLMINILFGYNSMRRTCQEIQVNLAYRWFLGLSIDEPVPNFSTWSQNYIRRYKDSSIFEEIFREILSQAVSYGFVDCTTVFGDSTHQKANANKRKLIKKEVEILKKKYEDDLLEEINDDRKCIGKETYDSMNRTESVFDEETGEELQIAAKKPSAKARQIQKADVSIKAKRKNALPTHTRHSVTRMHLS